MKHIKPELHELFGQGEEARINFILQDLWIGYPKSQEIFDKLEFLLKHPRISRMPSMLIVGETNNGKTVLANRYIQNNKPFLNESEERLIAPIIYVQAPPVPDEKRFYNAILDSTFTPYRINDKLDKRLQQVLHVLKSLDVKILVIDEIQHVLGGTISKRVSFLNVVKYISNELKISIVGMGTKEAFNAISTDDQLMNRFEPTVLPKWKYDQNYLRLLASYEFLLPLKNPSLIYKDQSLAKKILILSEGTIGEISTILKRSAVQAIRNGSERITRKEIEQINFVKPSERRYSKSILNA